MCVVSMIHQYGQHIAPDWWTPDKLKMYRLLVEGGQKFDEQTGQPHCEDPQKEAWYLQLIKRLDAIEEKLDKKGENVTPV